MAADVYEPRRARDLVWQALRGKVQAVAANVYEDRRARDLVRRALRGKI